MWRAGESTVLSYCFKVDEASSSLQPLSKTKQVGILISWSFVYLWGQDQRSRKAVMVNFFIIILELLNTYK